VQAVNCPVFCFGCPGYEFEFRSQRPEPRLRYISIRRSKVDTEDMIHGSLRHVAWGHKAATNKRGGRQERRQGERQSAYNPRGPPFETPHKGYHYTGQRGRFFEGWYWRVTLPGDAVSFALIYSIEDPQGGEFSGVGAQARPIVPWLDAWLGRSLARSLTHSLPHSLPHSFFHAFDHSLGHGAGRWIHSALFEGRVPILGRSG
jgi:hypothetical protein